MNKDQVKGTIDELAGTTKREAGHLTGNSELQVEGMAQQVKGKIEKAWGNAEETVREANEEAAVQHESRIDVAIENGTEDTERR